MRASACAMAAALAGLATDAAALPRVVPNVVAGAAHWAALPNTLTLNAIVELPDTCWSNPRFRAPPESAKSPAQTASIEIVATYATARLCDVVVKKAVVPAFDWRIYPNPKLKLVKFVGSARPLTAIIGKR